MVSDREETAGAKELATLIRQSNLNSSVRVDLLVSTDVVGIESTKDDTKCEQVVPLVESSADCFSHFQSIRVLKGED